VERPAAKPLMLLLAGAILLVASAWPSGPTANASQNSLVYLGAWVGERVNIPGDLDAFEQAVGKRMSIVHRYSGNPPFENGEHFNREWADEVRTRGGIPMLSWEPRLDAEIGLEQAASGSRDEYIRLWARELRDWGHPLFFRMMWEQNATWFPWGATGEPGITHYKTLWRRIVGIFREEGANRVTFVWSPHVSGYGASPVMDTYPGDEYVDWVALDGYPYKSGRGGFYDTFKPDYDIMVSQVDKPLMIAETSLESGSDQTKAEMLSDILGNQLPNSFPRVKALVWFDEMDCDGINYSILTAQGPLSRNAFRSGVASGYYASNSFGWLETAPIPVAEIAIQLPTPTATSTPSPTPTSTSTSTPTATATSTPTPTATLTPTGTATVTPRSTLTATGTATKTPMAARAATTTWTPNAVPTETAPPVPILPVNLLANPGFEDGTEGGRPALWMLSGFPESVSTDTTIVRSGVASIKHSSSTGPSYNVYQEVEIEGGRSYSFSGWVRVEDVKGYFNFSLQLLPLNVHGGVIQTVTLDSFRGTTGGWVEVKRANISMPAETARLRVVMKVDYLKATIFVDDLALAAVGTPLPTPTRTATATPTSVSTMTPSPTLTATVTPTSTSVPTSTPMSTATLAPTPTSSSTPTAALLASSTPTATLPQGANLLANPSFAEVQADGRHPAVWQWSFWADQEISVDYGADCDGFGGGLVLTGENASYLVYQNLPAEPQRRYFLSGWVNLPERRGGAFKAEMLPMNQFGGTVGPTFSKGYFLPTDGWQPFDMELTVPAGATQVRVQLKMESYRGVVQVDGLAFGPFITTSTATSPATSIATATATLTATSTPTATATSILVPPPPGNLIENPSFRSVGPMGAPLGWTVSSWATSKVTVDAWAAYDGDGRGLKQEGDGSSYVVYQDLPAEPAARYALTGWLRLPQEESGSYRIELSPMNLYGGNVGGTQNLSFSWPEYGWRGFRLDVTTPPNVARLRVQFRVDRLVGIALVDALSLVPLE